jgi:outer membrane lipoprotein-sorting protein
MNLARTLQTAAENTCIREYFLCCYITPDFANPPTNSAKRPVLGMISLLQRIGTKMYKALAIALSFFYLANAASAATSSSRGIGEPAETGPAASPTTILTKNSADGTAMFQALTDRIKGLKSYWYDSTLTTYQDKPVRETGRLYFKHPNLVRFEVKSAGMKSGAVVVRQPDGIIKGKMGGLFGAMKMTLTPNSKLLKTANGYNVLDSDLYSLLESTRGEPVKYVVSQSPTAYPGVDRAFIMELIETDGDVAHRIILDEKRKLPLEWNVFKNKRLFSTMKLNELQIRPDLTDELFVFEAKPQDIAKLTRGITIASSLNEIEIPRCIPTSQLKLSTDALHKLQAVVKEIRDTANNLKSDVSGEAVKSVIGSSPALQSGTTATLPKSELKADIAAEQPITGDHYVAWSPRVARSVLVHDVTLDALVDTVQQFTKELQLVDDKAGSPKLSEQWNTVATNMDTEVDAVLKTLDSDKPDEELITRQSAKIIEQTNQLDEIIQKAFTVL